MGQKLKIKVILGSTREGRFGDKPAYWMVEELKKIEGIEGELLDLRNFNMPFLNSATTPSMAGRKYSDEMVQRWSKKIDEGDAYVFITPEYNHGYPAVLKNALDVLFPEWGKKPIGFVGYGSVGGARSIEQLREVAIELKMVPIRSSINIPADVYMKAVGEKIPFDLGVFAPIRNSMMGDRLKLFIDDLVWHANALKAARESAAK